jgi:hypothetical protein
MGQAGTIILGAAGGWPGYGAFATPTISGEVVDPQFGSEAVETPKRPFSGSTVSVVTVLFAAAPRAMPVAVMSASRTAGGAPAFRSERYRSRVSL